MDTPSANWPRIRPLPDPDCRFTSFYGESTAETAPFLRSAAASRDPHGTLLFTALVVIKATDRRRYERQLLDSKSELQKGLATERETAELREQFIAVLGHDLRNPLAAISAGARICSGRARCRDKKSSASST